MKTCSKCSEELVVNQNWRVSSVRINQKICYPCLKHYQKIYYSQKRPLLIQKNTAWRSENPDKIRAINGDYRSTISGRARCMLSPPRSKCKKKGLDFDLTESWVEERLIRGICEVTGIPFQLGQKRGPHTPSIDRIRPGEGYTQDNCQMVVYIYNLAKGTFTHEDVVDFCRIVLR